MTDIGELVSLAMSELPKEDCPFCTSEKSKKKETLKIEEHTCSDSRKKDSADDRKYTLVNDSGKLTTNILPKPHWLVKLRMPKMYSVIIRRNEKNEYFFKRYKKNSRYYLESFICPNAHHIIPGNDALARAKPLIKWMAHKVEWYRVRYLKGADGLTQELKYALKSEKRKTDKEKIDVDETAITTYTITKKGNPKKEQTRVISGKVTGKVTYDVNNSQNGVWLPANNAVLKWSKIESKLQKAYASGAIMATSLSEKKHQFHDAHRPYSAEVKKGLLSIAKELSAIAISCIADESHDSKNGKDLPAPQCLVNVLNRYSTEIKNRKLVGKKSSWKKPWLTSKRSLE
jgi:hypothetical protein